MPRFPPPLTDLVIAMSHSPDLVDRVFSKREDENLIEEFGVTPKQLETLRSDDLNAISAAVQQEQEEHGTQDAGVQVTGWIRVAKWIRS